MMEIDEFSLEVWELLDLIGGLWTCQIDPVNCRVRLELMDSQQSPYLGKYNIGSGWVELTNWDDLLIKAHNLNKRYWFYKKLSDEIPLERFNEFRNLRLLGVWEEDSVCGFDAAADHPDYTNIRCIFEKTQWTQGNEEIYPEIDSSFFPSTASQLETSDHPIQLRTLNTSELRNLIFRVDNLCFDNNCRSLTLNSRTGWIHSRINNHLGGCELNINSWSGLTTYFKLPSESLIRWNHSVTPLPFDALHNACISSISRRYGNTLEFKACIDGLDISQCIYYRFRNCKWSIQARDLSLLERDTAF